MSEWKPYLVQAKIGSMTLLTESCPRRYAWRLSTHGTPGTKGDAKRQHGRQSIVDDVTCLLTVPEVAQLIAIADRPDPVTWAHPLLPPVTGHLENLNIPTDKNIYGYFKVTFSFVEAFDRAAQQASAPKRLSAPSSRAKANGVYKGLMSDLDDLDDIPTDATGAAFNSSVGDLDAAFDGVDAAFEGIVSPDGAGTWRDLSRALDTFAEAADTMVDAVREIESSLGAAAYAIETTPLRLKEIIGEAVESLKTPQGVVASFVTQQASDLYSMMADAGVEITEANIVALMQDNGIRDPLAIPAGMTIAIQVAS